MGLKAEREGRRLAVRGRAVDAKETSGENGHLYLRIERRDLSPTPGYRDDIEAI